MTADQDVSNAGNGVDGNGNQLPFAKVAMFYESNPFGLSTDYAFPEGSNTSSSRWDQITSLAKLWTRKRTMSDGIQYDAHDALFTILKWVLEQAPTINKTTTPPAA